MALQFIFGPSGSGKSYTLYQSVIRESVEHPEQNFIVLVPEQFTMQTQKDLVSMHPRRGIMNIDVLSFARLAYRVFEETGGGSLPVLDDEGKNLILRKIAADYEDQLKVLKGNIRKLGYISEIKSVLSEFAQYDIGEEEIRKVMEASGKDSRLYYKLQDLKILYRGFTKYLEDRYITKEELLDVLRREVKKSEMLKNSVVVLDGFTGFTPVQNRLLLELLRYCRKVCVTVTVDEREDPFTYRHPYQLFALSKQMASGLLKLAEEAKTEIKEPVRLFGEVPKRFENSPSLKFLERNLFRYQTETFTGQPEGVQVFAAANPREEAMAAAGRIRALVRKERYRYREIGVIVSDMNVYAEELKQAFQRYEIPFFMDQKKSILLNPFIEYLRSLLFMAEQNFTADSVFRFLRTNLSGFSMEETDALENYVTGLGIKGYKKWQERWIRRMKFTTEEDLEKFNHCRVQLVEKVDGLLYVLKQRKKTVRDITMALYEFMVREDLQRKLKRREEEFQASGRLALAKEYAQVYRIVIELFDKLTELLGDEEVSLKEYARLLDAGLEEARVGVIPPSPDQVVTGDMQRTRLKDMKALLFVGASDTYLPGNLLRTGLLSERDRERFLGARVLLSPGGKEKAYEQKFYLYLNLTKPSRRLEIFYSRLSPDGKTMRPSYLIQEIRKLYPDLQVGKVEEAGFSDREWTDALGFAEWAKGIPGAMEAPDKVWMELYRRYRQDPKYAGEAERLMKAGSYQRPSDPLTKETAKRLYGEDFEASITRIEGFSACAFAHFLTYGLKLRERETYEFQAVDLGNICHKALEYFSAKTEKEQKDWTQLTGEERNRLMDESVEEAVTDYGNNVLYSSARNEYLIRRIKIMLERTIWAVTRQLEAGDFRPSAYEMRFRGGKIDRIDTCTEEDKVYVKVVDYKTGKKAFDITALYHGLQLQLMVYLDAAVQMEAKKHPGKEVIPAGVFYYRIEDPMVEKQEGLQPEQVEEELLRELKPDGVINCKDEVLRHLDRNKEGESLAAPLKYNRDGSLSRTSKAVPEEMFGVMMEHAVSQVKRVQERILDGEIGIRPYRRGQETGCDYCRYRNICGFDTEIGGYEYREIYKMSLEEAISAMKGAKGHGDQLDRGTKTGHLPEES